MLSLFFIKYLVVKASFFSPLLLISQQTENPIYSRPSSKLQLYIVASYQTGHCMALSDDHWTDSPERPKKQRKVYVRYLHLFCSNDECLMCVLPQIPPQVLEQR